MSKLFEERYPNIAVWVRDGWVELGRNYGRSFTRVLDEGGLVWEGEEYYGTVDEALAEADKAIAEWTR